MSSLSKTFIKAKEESSNDFIFAFHDEEPELEAWADEPEAGGAVKKKRKKKKKAGTTVTTVDAEIEAKAPGIESSVAPSSSTEATSVIETKKSQALEQLGISQVMPGSVEDMTTVGKKDKNSKKKQGGESGTVKTTAGGDSKSNATAAPSGKKKKAGATNAKGGKKQAKVDDDDEDWYVLPTPEPDTSVAVSAVHKASKNDSSTGPRFKSAKEGGAAKYGNGRNLVKHGPVKIRDPKWLQRPPGLPTMAEVTARGTVSDNDDTVAKAATGGKKPVLHSSPFSFGFV
jgi:hypothetical protein